MNRKPKAQLKTADKLQAKLVLTIGENELNEGIVNVKSMATREEKAFPLSAIHDSFDEVYDEMMTKMIEELKGEIEKWQNAQPIAAMYLPNLLKKKLY